MGDTGEFAEPGDTNLSDATIKPQVATKCFLWMLSRHEVSAGICRDIFIEHSIELSLLEFRRLLKTHLFS